MASLMNGLSALGQGVSQFAGTAGLELQKSQLAQQQAILADQLATTRETTLQGQQQTFQAGQQASQQAFQGSQTDKELAARASEGAATRAAELQRTQMTINAPPETIKLLRALGALPDPNAPASAGSAPAASTTDGSSAPLPGPRATGGVAADGSVVPAIGTATSGATGVTGAASPAGGSPMDNPLVRKALGMPAVGSPEATRYAIAQDVNSDPAFKYKTAGQRAAEVESRLAVADGKMTDPESRKDMAAMIASYQLPPLENFALTKPGGPETMALVKGLNPDYQSSRYPEIQKAMTAFGSGPQGNVIRSNNVGIQHLDVFDQAADALANSNVGALNSLKNTFQQQFGSPAPSTFDGLKQIVGTEIEKAVAGGIGSSADRDRLMAALDRARSPAQLKAMTDGFRSLMVGQLSGLKTQYEEATGIKSGPFAFENKLAPATVARLGAHSGGAASTAATGYQTDVAPTWQQRRDAALGGQTTSAAPAASTPALKPPAIGEVQQGYTFSGGDPADPASWKAAN